MTILKPTHKDIASGILLLYRSVIILYNIFRNKLINPFTYFILIGNNWNLFSFILRNNIYLLYPPPPPPGGGRDLLASFTLTSGLDTISASATDKTGKKGGTQIPGGRGK